MTNLLTKLIFLNSMILLLVIIIAGSSVKDYACFLVNSEQIVGQELVETLNSFLWKVGILTFLFIGLFHYFTVKKMINPIKLLSHAAKNIQQGKAPEKVIASTSGELAELIGNFNSMSESLVVMQNQREEMLRDIAHELRTPLTNINGYLEALENGVIEGNTEIFTSLLEESKRITRIVELISELNSWHNGIFFQEKCLEKLDVKKLLTEAINPFQLKLQKRFTDLQINLEDTSVLVYKDGLMQAFTNILQNIIDYNTGEALKIEGTINQDCYLIYFIHKGQYIEPDKKDQIFERFYRMESSRTTKSHGAGLGLAITKSIILAHKGMVGIDTDGIHHTFWIRLPIQNKG
ncbi:two-component system sensor histidine kinase BaeS [Bacillus tianshenii]|uniref:histidine kinase n=2 Tax=Sutcliffiella tianshenii TaxID=1463404 RepID=A0ABS2P521_9BACI|nr:two-component system sensor histidine kinase BaeS [Bacillus tianshenii]